MEKENLNGMMDKFMRVNGKQVLNVALECGSQQMGVNTRVNGLTINNMAKENILIIPVHIKVNLNNL